LITGLGSYSDVSRSINGWLADWLLDETTGEVAIAGNRAKSGVLASSSYPGPELLDTSGDGVMDAANWTAGNSATLTNPSVGTLRIARNGVNNPFATQAVTTIGKRYKFPAEARSDGNASPRLVNQPDFVDGTTSTDWQALQLENETNDTAATIQSVTSTGTEYTEWRNLSVKEANPLNGDHSNVTVGVAGNGRGIRYAAEYDGATSFTDIYSAELNTILDTDKGSLVAWGKADAWGATRTIAIIGADANNQIDIFQFGGDLRVRYTAGGVSKTITILPSATTTVFFMATITWDVNAGATGEVKGYYNGSFVGGLTNLGTWVGNLASDSCVIGAGSTAPVTPWDGDIAPIDVYDEPITQSQITSIWQAGNS
jgi:hypothetical protein